MHVLIEWYKWPVLLFSDFARVGAIGTEKLRDAATNLYMQHVVLGLRVGQLLAFEINDRLLMCVGVMMKTKVPQTKPTEGNRLWKHVAPYHAEFAVLPEDLGRAFCSKALWVSFATQRAAEYWIWTLLP